MISFVDSELPFIELFQDVVAFIAYFSKVLQENWEPSSIMNVNQGKHPWDNIFSSLRLQMNIKNKTSRSITVNQ